MNAECRTQKSEWGMGNHLPDGSSIPHSPFAIPHSSDRVQGDIDALDLFAAEIKKVEETIPRHLNVDPEHLENGLARLVLTLIDLLRRLLEKQAMRRMEGGSLNDAEIERLGLAFMRMEVKMEEFKTLFGLDDEDLNINLGPLGNLW